MNSSLYRLVAWGFQNLIWNGRLIDARNLPANGPAILVANHLRSLGPIAVGGSVPLQMYSWIHADMLDPRLAPDYLRRDFIEPQLHLPRPFSLWLAKLIAWIHVPLLQAIGGIPVYHDADGLGRTYRRTVDLLEQGECILIFPEDPDLPMDARYEMTPFKKGFTRLGELFYERTRRALVFYPLAVHAESRTVRAGLPVRYQPLNSPLEERRRLKSMLEGSIHAMLLRASTENYLSQPLPN